MGKKWKLPAVSQMEQTASPSQRIPEAEVASSLWMAADPSVSSNASYPDPSGAADSTEMATTAMTHMSLMSYAQHDSLSMGRQAEYYSGGSSASYLPAQGFVPDSVGGYQSYLSQGQPASMASATDFTDYSMLSTAGSAGYGGANVAVAPWVMPPGYDGHSYATGASSNPSGGVSSSATQRRPHHGDTTSSNKRGRRR
ncbi:hypothetical protein [Streptomyces fumanus]|uniref:hypothetical protein n=1 Tax=Streptomyces fumanus TaxID=67302 RepID=UPI0033DB28AD